MKKRILFVDDHPKSCGELQNNLTQLEPEWELIFTNSTVHALKNLGGEPFDAVVAAERLPVVNGAQLLNEIMERFPQIQRFLLADLSDIRSIVKCVGTAHQFLGRTSDVRILHAALKRAQSLEIWLPDQNVTRLLGQMHKLPSPPALYFRVVKELQSPTASLENVGNLIERDPAMMAKILQLVNSASFGMQHAVLGPVEAVLQLGVEKTKAIILLAHSYSYFDTLGLRTFSIDQLWQHSVLTGNFARRLARQEQAEDTVVEESYTAGLMHDLGKLALAANLPRQYQEAVSTARAQSLPQWEAEQVVFGASHAELGACLLAIWGMPISIVEATALHHLPTKLFSRDFAPLTAVHVANAFSHAKSRDQARSAVDEEYLSALGLQERMEAWWTVCQETNLT